MRSWSIHLGWAIVTVFCVSVALRRRAELPSAPPKFATSSPSSPEPEAAPAAAAAAPLPEARTESPVKEAAALSPEQRIRELLLKEPNYWQECSDTLGRIQERELKLELLREMLKSKGNLRYLALQILSGMEGRDVAEIAEEYLRRPNADHYPKRVFAVLLGKIGDSSSVRVLDECLRSSNDEEIRLSCAASLLKLGQPTAADTLMASLVRLYENEDGSLRKKAVEQIAKLQPEKALPLLLRALRDSNGEVRLEALYAVAELKKPELLPHLQALEDDPNPEVAQEAKDAVEALKEARK